MTWFIGVLLLCLILPKSLVEVHGMGNGIVPLKRYNRQGKHTEQIVIIIMNYNLSNYFCLPSRCLSVCMSVIALWKCPDKRSDIILFKCLASINRRGDMGTRFKKKTFFMEFPVSLHNNLML